MKRWFPILLAVLLCLSCPALADVIESPSAPGTSPAPTFADSLLDWAGELDLGACDLVGSAFSGDASCSARLRGDDALLELAVPDLLTLQLSEEAVALNASGQTYVLELQPLRDAFFEARRLPYSLGDDGQYAVQWLYRAFREILLPSVDYTSGYNGFSFHVRLDEREFWERAGAFIDSALRDEELRDMYARYARYFRSFIPGLPATAEELRTACRRFLDRRDPRFIGWTVEGDVQANPGMWGGRLEVACAFHVERQISQADISFEYAPTYDGFSMAASVSGSMDIRRYSCAASLESHGNAVYGTLDVDAEESASYVLSAVRGDGAIDGDLVFRRDGTPVWTTSVHGRVDPGTRAVTGTVLRTDHSDPEGAAETLASLELNRWDGGCAGTLGLPDGTLNFRAVSYSNYMHVSAKMQSADRMPSGDSLDFWLFRRGGNEYRVRLDATSAGRGRLYRRVRLTGEAGPTGISFEYSDPMYGKATTGSIHYVETDDGFYFGLEYNPGAPQFYRFTGTDRLPFGIHVTRAGNTCRISLSDTRFFYLMKADATIELNGSGGIGRLEGNLERRNSMNQGDLHAANFIYTPGKITATVDSQTYTLEKAFEDERQITYQLTNDRSSIPAYITLRLDDDLRTLTGSVRVNDLAMAGFSIAAADKTQIVPLDTSGAINVDQAWILRALYGSPAADSAPAREAAEEAVEEAAEAASDEGFFIEE